MFSALEWVKDVAKNMSDDATALDLSRASFEKAQEHLARLANRDVAILYENSYDFLSQSFAELDKKPVFVDHSDPISPEVIFASQHLETWAREQMEELDRRYKALEIFQPEYSIFIDLFSEVEQAAQDFPQGTAVQNAVVSGVLGHHMLEDLDEHVLELEELAKALDPIQVRKFRDQNRRPLPIDGDGPMSRRFSTYLLRRALNAESHPKNLRMLYGLLEAQDRGNEQREHVDLTMLVQPYQGMWNTKGVKNKSIGSNVAAHLALVLAELQQNHLKHSRISDDTNGVLGPIVKSKKTSGTLTLEFYFELGKGNLERLMRLERNGLNYPIEPNRNLEVPSSGTGLYLARLAAAVVSWDLTLRKPRKVNRNYGICEFHLKPPRDPEEASR